MSLAVLFLDDKVIRRDGFVARFGFEPIWITNSKDVIEVIGKHYWDMISLDHDLIDGDNGMLVVDWIIKHRPSIGSILVHSTNIDRSMRMISRLRDSGYFVRYSPIETDLP